MVFNAFIDYPDEDWNIFDRHRVTRNYWDKQENVLQFMEKIKSEFRIENDEDWYRISLIQIKERGGEGLLKRYSHRLLHLLETAYPDKDWNLEKSSRRDKRSVQRWLFLKVEELFEGYEIIEDFFYEKLDRSSCKALQFDLYIPRLDVAFEFQGIHHSKEIPAFGSVDMYQARDREKQLLCEQHDITLVVIPHFWDLSENHLIDIIKNCQPQLSEYFRNDAK